MNSEQEIKNWISDLIVDFPKINIKYAFDDIIEYHIIEVSPESIEKSEKYSKSYLDFLDSFNNKYPNDSILISTPSDFHNMTNIVKCYNGINPFTNNVLDTEFNLKNNHNTSIFIVYPIAA